MLYIVSTPIGNLDDLSLRQAKTVAVSDIILAEDTRSFQTLKSGIIQRFSLSFNPRQKLISYYKEKEFEKLPAIIDELKQGKTVSLVSESGTPLISDPGYLLVKSVLHEQIPFTLVPGPVSLVAALVMSGFNPKQFMFLGFLPKNKSEIAQLLNKLILIKGILKDIVFIAFESSKRINTTLSLIIASGWNPDIAIAREVTKKFEEVVRGKPAELIKQTFKGEITLVIR